VDLQPIWRSDLGHDRQAGSQRGDKGPETQKTMTVDLLILINMCVGIAFTALLFYRFPGLPSAEKNGKDFPSVSIIIPARNEEKNLKLLLEDLKTQSIKPLEIICVNDDSSDGTAQVAEAYGATLVNLRDKPEGWTGKTWACQNGADIAKGALLLFLDADVRLGQNALSRLVHAYQAADCTISVQPFHTAKEPYEQFSFLFNLIQIAANGTSLPRNTNIGLHGPVLLLAKADYAKIGGHESVRQCVVEDMVFGQKLKQNHLPYQLFVGDKDVSYRMYPGGLRSLVQGWVKNFAFGATKTNPLVLLMIILWLGSMITVPIYLVLSVGRADLLMLGVYGLLYLLWVLILGFLANRIGRFHVLPIILFPVLVAGFLLIFFFSLITKVFGLPVTWKGRVITGKDEA